MKNKTPINNDIFKQTCRSPLYEQLNGLKDVNWQGVGIHQLVNGVANALVSKVSATDGIMAIISQFFSTVNSPSTLKASVEGIRIRTHTAKVVINKPGDGYFRKAPNFHSHEIKEKMGKTTF